MQKTAISFNYRPNISSSDLAEMSKLTLNVVSLEPKTDVELTVGIQPYDKSVLDELRQRHRGDYLVKRGGDDGNSILTVARRAGLPPLGTSTSNHKLAESPWLLAPLALEALLEFFAAMQRPILGHRSLRIVSQRPANLFPADAQLPPWLQRRVVLEFETRTIHGADRRPSVILACGVRTRNVIDANCAETIRAGIDVHGRYINVRLAPGDPRLQPFPKLAGRVVDIRGSRLILDDHSDGHSEVEEAEVFLEPRNENLIWCVQHLLGDKAERVLQATANAATAALAGPGRLDLIDKTLTYLRGKSIELVPGVPLLFGPLAARSRQSWSFRSETIKRPNLVFDPSGTRTDTWNEGGLDRNGPYDQRTFSPKQLRIAVLCQADYEVR